MSAEGTTDATARAADPNGATDPGVGGETVPPVTKLESSEDVPAEKRARRPDEATGSGKTIVQPPEEVKARLAERQKKQRERAEAARAEAARRQAEEQAAAKAAASRERSDEKKAPAESSKAPADAVSEKDRRLARQKELAARREHSDQHGVGRAARRRRALLQRAGKGKTPGVGSGRGHTCRSIVCLQTLTWLDVASGVTLM